MDPEAILGIYVQEGSAELWQFFSADDFTPSKIHTKTFQTFQSVFINIFPTQLN